MREYNIVKNYEEEIASTDRMIELYKDGLKQERKRKRHYQKRLENHQKRMSNQ
jgi:hypothetical protein